MSRVLVVGVGGLGAEIVHNLLKSTLEVSVLDYDVVDAHTISRHALLNGHLETIGMTKVNALHALYPSVRVRCGRAEDQDIDYFEQFDVIIGAVDNIDARRFLNAAIYQCKTEKILIDGGTEGWMGHARMVSNRRRGCVECHMGLFAWDNVHKPVCTTHNQLSNDEDVIATAPFVNAVIGGIMVSMIYNRDAHTGIIYNYNALTGYLNGTALLPHGDCLICNHIRDANGMID